MIQSGIDDIFRFVGLFWAIRDEVEKLDNTLALSHVMTVVGCAIQLQDMYVLEQRRGRLFEIY